MLFKLHHATRAVAKPLVIAETGSFQQAARNVASQSTISRQIQALEADLGLQLFHSSGKADAGG